MLFRSVSQSRYDKVHATFIEKTGYECAKWLVDYCIKNYYDLPGFIVHSMNPVGKMNIELYLNNFKKFKAFLKAKGKN